MSEPTYRITTEHTGDFLNTWEARAVRISDGENIANGYGTSNDAALIQVLDLLAHRADNLAAGRVYFADENGKLMDGVRPAPEPQSIRA